MPKREVLEKLGNPYPPPAWVGPTFEASPWHTKDWKFKILFAFNGGYSLDDLRRIKAKRFGKIQELNQIDPTLAALDISHERLPAPKPFRELDLCELRRLSPLYEKHPQRLMTRRAERAGHCFRLESNEAEQLIEFTDNLESR
jgi:hypothetical protein